MEEQIKELIEKYKKERTYIPNRKANNNIERNFDIAKAQALYNEKTEQFIADLQQLLTTEKQ